MNNLFSLWTQIVRHPRIFRIALPSRVHLVTTRNVVLDKGGVTSEHVLSLGTRFHPYVEYTYSTDKTQDTL